MTVIQSLTPPSNKCPGYCPTADSMGDVFNRNATTFPTNWSWSSCSLFKHAHTMAMKNLWGRKFAVFESILKTNERAKERGGGRERRRARGWEGGGERGREREEGG